MLVQKAISAFQKAQAKNDYATCIQFLTDSVNDNPELFCQFLEIATFTTIDNYLASKQFITKTTVGFNYNYSALCNLNSQQINCIIERIKSVHIHEKELQNALKIAGLNLCDSTQKANYINNYLLTSSENAAADMHLISNLIKIQPGNKYFEQALHSIILMTDKKTALLFLDKTGFIKCNRRTDEYTEYHPEKIKHLNSILKDSLLVKAGVKNLSILNEN